MPNISFHLALFPNQSDDEITHMTVSGAMQLSMKQLDITFQLAGNINVLQLPEITPTPSRTDKLWENTCFEVFVAEPRDPNYWEYNISPSHNWAVFHFTGYRSAKSDELTVDKIIVNSHSISPNQYQIQTILPLPQALHNKNLQVGVSTILRDRQDTIYYYALTHLSQNPDFHDRNCFTLLLNAES